MTSKEIESHCFSGRMYCIENLEELLLDDLKYSKGQTVYFRPLKEILANPRVTDCHYNTEAELFEIKVDDGNTFEVSLKDFTESRIIKDHSFGDVEINGTDKAMAYYIFVDKNLNSAWADEFMITDSAPMSKREKLLQRVRYIK